MSSTGGEDDYSQARDRMVEEQLEARGISDEKILSAFRTVPRHQFVNPSHRDKAYEDRALPTQSGQTISQPYMVAFMTEKLEVEPDQKVLEIGTGSGYQTAILLELETTVHTVETVESLSFEARNRLAELGYSSNVHFRIGDGSRGWPEYAPYDRIIVTAGAPEVPEPLKDQAGDHARIVIPIGSRRKQSLRVLERINGKGWTKSDLTNCVFVPLKGDEGWAD